MEAGGGDLRRQARFLAAKQSSVARDEFVDLQQALGITHQEHSILLDRDLDNVVNPVDHYLHDFMHCLFVDGVCNINVYLLFEACMDAGKVDVYRDFSGFLALFEWPGRIFWHEVPDIFLTKGSQIIGRVCASSARPLTC